MTSTPRSKRTDRPPKRKRDTGEADHQGPKRLRKQKNNPNGVAGSPEKKETPKKPTRDASPEASPAKAVVVHDGLKTNSLAITPAKGDNLQATSWNVSRPLGGRIADIDPILTPDERYLLLAYTTSIQVYTAADSLLIRRITISTTQKDPFTIVAARLCPLNTNNLRVACSDGRVWLMDWTTGSVHHEPLVTESETAVDMVIFPLRIGKDKTEVSVVSERAKNGPSTVVAYTGDASGDQRTASTLLELTHTKDQIHSLRLVGKYLFAASQKTLVVGVPKGGKIPSLSNLTYSFYYFDTNDIITALDARISASIKPIPGRRTAKEKQSREPHTPIFDVIVGGARGPIYFYNDLVAKLLAKEKGQPDEEGLVGRRYHWHRRAVHALRWSKDGNYMISGGSEHTLAIWQMDTAKMNFLPHLPGVIENIVLSDSGSSYVLHLDDNSAMILSTAELEPTTYVSGIQSATHQLQRLKDQWVTRVWTANDTPMAVPAALHPEIPGRLYLTVGSGNQATIAGDVPSAPFVQTVDLESFRSVSKQAVARAHPSDSVITSEGRPVTDPLVTHLAFSHDGKWLATIDEWTPSVEDMLILGEEQEEVFARDRREIHLKFWEVGTEDDSEENLALASRVDSPHVTTSPETVFGLASDPTSTRFATIGNDGAVRIWRPKLRQQDGIAVTKASGESLHTWTCAQIISLSDQLGLESLSGHGATEENQGCIAFSEDGSTLFAAYGAGDDGSVYVIDARSGEVKKVLDGLWFGTLRGMHVLSPYVVVLSDILKVHDVVADELRYGMPLSPSSERNFPEYAIHMGADARTRHFAIALPFGRSTEVSVFSPESATPVLLQRIPGRVVSLVTSPQSSGFIVLDDAAQLRTIAEGTDTEALAVAQPLEDMRLDDVDVSEEREAIVFTGDIGEDSEHEDEDEDEEMGNGAVEDVAMDIDEDDDEAAHPAVVNQPRLAAIFDAAPAFAMPAIEDVFYKVAGLLATKKVAA